MNHKNNKNHTEKSELRFVYLSILILLITFMIIPYSFSGSFAIGLTVTRAEYNNDSVNTEANKSIFIDAKNSTDTELTFVINADTTNQSVNITKHITNPTNETLPKPSLNKYITLNISDALKNSLVYDLMKIFYTDREINNAMIDESTIIILYFNETSSTWHELTGDLDYVNSVGLNTTEQGDYSGYAFANLSMFSIYALGGLLVDGASCASASQCSGSYCCSNLCQSSACVTEAPPGDDGGGGGGGGGSSGGTIQKPSYEITLFDEAIKVRLRQGESADFFLDIQNTGTEKLKLTLKIDGLKDMISIEGKTRAHQFEIKPVETKSIKLTFFAKETLKPDIYVTKLSITGKDIDEELPVIVEVSTKEAALFDVDIEILEDYQKVKAGEKIIAKLTIYNMGATQRVDTEITYSIKDLDGNIIISDKETIAVETVAEFTRTMLLPSYLQKGTYILDVMVTYNGLTAASSKTFEIIEEKEAIAERPVPQGIIPLNLVFYLVAALGALLIMLTLLNIASSTQYKRRTDAIGKNREQIQKEEMPKRGIPAKIKRHPEASPKQYFFLKDRRKLKNLEELKEAFRNMDEKTFRHHVYKEKNDFASWTEHIFKDSKLTRKLRKAKTKEKSYDILKKYLDK